MDRERERALCERGYFRLQVPSKLLDRSIDRRRLSLCLSVCLRHPASAMISRPILFVKACYPVLYKSCSSRVECSVFSGRLCMCMDRRPRSDLSQRLCCCSLETPSAGMSTAAICVDYYTLYSWVGDRCLHLVYNGARAETWLLPLFGNDGHCSQSQSIDRFFPNIRYLQREKKENESLLTHRQTHTYMYVDVCVRARERENTSRTATLTSDSSVGSLGIDRRVRAC